MCLQEKHRPYRRAGSFFKLPVCKVSMCYLLKLELLGCNARDVDRKSVRTF